MDYELQIEYPMQSLYIAKLFHEHGRLDRLLDCIGHDATLSWDELGWLEQAALGNVFADSRYYQQRGWQSRHGRDEPDRDVYVLRDPLLTRYDRLCRELEQCTGMTKVENRFAADLEAAVHRNMQFRSYSYDYRWTDSAGSGKEAKLVLFLFEEFDTFYDAVDALFSILDFCAEGLPHLEAALAEGTKQKAAFPPGEAALREEAA